MLPLGSIDNGVVAHRLNGDVHQLVRVLLPPNLIVPVLKSDVRFTAGQCGIGRIDVPLRNSRPTIPMFVGEIHLRRRERFGTTFTETRVFSDARLLETSRFWIDHRKREGLIITLPIAAAAAACGFLGPTDSHTINTLDTTEFPLDGSGKCVVLVCVALGRGELNANDRIVDRDI